MGNPYFYFLSLTICGYVRHRIFFLFESCFKFITIFGDQAYWKEADRQAFAARGVRYRISRRPKRKPLSQRWRMINRARSRLRQASVSGAQAALGLHQSELSRLGQELGAGADRFIETEASADVREPS
jgi:hypothetical protein